MALNISGATSGADSTGLEELYQSKSWGVDEEAEQSRQCVKNELLEIEEFLHGKK